jgi:hypothetical protein
MTLARLSVPDLLTLGYMTALEAPATLQRKGGATEVERASAPVLLTAAVNRNRGDLSIALIDALLKAQIAVTSPAPPPSAPSSPPSPASTPTAPAPASAPPTPAATLARPSTLRAPSPPPIRPLAASLSPHRPPRGPPSAACPTSRQVRTPSPWSPR